MSHETRHQQLAEQTHQRKDVFKVLARSKSGAHGKSNKAKRANDKRKWQREAFH